MILTVGPIHSPPSIHVSDIWMVDMVLLVIRIPIAPSRLRRMLQVHMVTGRSYPRTRQVMTVFLVVPGDMAVEWTGHLGNICTRSASDHWQGSYMTDNLLWP